MDWEIHKEILRVLRVQENLDCDNIMTYMKDHHDFHARCVSRHAIVHDGWNDLE